MWTKGTWCSSVENVFSPVSIKKKPKKNCRSRNEDVQEKPLVSDPPKPTPVEASCPTLAAVEDESLVEVEDELAKHAFPVVDATDAAASAAAEAAEQARSLLQTLKGSVRLKSHIVGATLARQTSNALKYMQTQCRVQSQVRSRGVRMSLVNQGLPGQLLHAKELENLKVRDEWDESLLSKERTEANLLEKYEAAMRQERSLAYSYAQQQKWNESSKSTNVSFKGQNKPVLGWIWLDRWMNAIEPWENHTMAGKDHNSNRNANLRIPGGEVTKCFARRPLNSPTTQKSHIHHSHATARSNTACSSSARKQTSVISNRFTDSRNSLSSLSDRNGWHRITGSLAGEYMSLASPPSVPRYMALTHSAIAKLKLPSRLGMESCGTAEKKGWVDRPCKEVTSTCTYQN